MEYFDAVGNEIEAAWKKVHYDPRAFPDLAAQALSARHPADHFGSRDLSKWALTAELPMQANVRANFGEPALTVFRSRHFIIEALHWLLGTTAIHQHAFSGAFCLLQGASIQTRYRFRSVKHYGPCLRVGQLKVHDVAILGGRCVEPIVAGRALIHSVYHFMRPTISIVVRTNTDPFSGQQFRYALPGLAIGPFGDEPVGDRRLKMLEFALRSSSPDFETMVNSAFQYGEGFSAYKTLSKLRDLTGGTDSAGFRRILEVARSHIPEIVTDLLPQLREEDRQDHIVKAFRKIGTRRQRWLLSLLLNVPSRKHVLDLVGAEDSQTPPESLVSQLLWEFVESGLLPMEKDEMSRDLLRAISQGRTAPEIRAELAALPGGHRLIDERLREALAQPILGCLLENVRDSEHAEFAGPSLQPSNEQSASGAAAT